ncbi:MAG: hypothetical protein JWM82_865 [Myxococcales bacterium]|nr:hypothetical protein [Myxococcales bacterium]
MSDGDAGAGAFLGRLTAKLDAADVLSMVVGSFASSFHGVPRSSQDLDLVIDPRPESLLRFLADLPPTDTLISKLEWAKQGGGSELQLRDVAGILQLRGDELDHTYIEHWVVELGLTDIWFRARGDGDR